jgi:hypothetical protein
MSTSEPYDLDAQPVTEAGDRVLMDKVARTGQDPTWASPILRERCKIRTVGTGPGGRSVAPAKNLEDVLLPFSAHDLSCPGVAPLRDPDDLGLGC